MFAPHKGEIEINMHITEADPTDFQHQAQQIEVLLNDIQLSPDTDLKIKALTLIRTLMDFHSTGIDRMMEVIAGSDQNPASIFDKFSGDNLISSLLLLYGLHPRGITERVEIALDKARNYVHSQGGTVELVQTKDGIVRLILDYKNQGNASSAAILKKAVEDAVYESAPDAIEINITEINRPSHLAFVPLNSLRRNPTSQLQPAVAK